MFSLTEAAEKSRKSDEIMKEFDTEDDANVNGGRDRRTAIGGVWIHDGAEPKIALADELSSK